MNEFDGKERSPERMRGRPFTSPLEGSKTPHGRNASDSQSPSKSPPPLASTGWSLGGSLYPGESTSSSFQPGASARSRSPGKGIRPEELTCFKRWHYPSPGCERKAEVYWSSVGSFRHCASEGGLHRLPATKGEFWKHEFKDSSPLQHARRQSIQQHYQRTLPLEVQTDHILEQILPRNQSPQRPAGSGRSAASSQAHAHMHESPHHGALLESAGRIHPATRLVQFGRAMLDRLSTMKNAFATFVDTPWRKTDTVNKMEFSSFLLKHFSTLPQHDHDRIFDLVNIDRSGRLSVADFNRAVDAVGPVESLDNLRQRWLALGFPSMQSALNAMKETSDVPRHRLPFAEFSQALMRVGVEDPREHLVIYQAILDPAEPTGVTLEQLASAIAVVSPALLVEDLRDRIHRQYGSFEVALQDMSAFSCMEFVTWSMRQFGMTKHEAQKVFRLMNVRGHERIGIEEFSCSLRLVKPSLALEEVRRKVRQWLHNIRAHACSNRWASLVAKISKPVSRITTSKVTGHDGGTMKSAHGELSRAVGQVDHKRGSFLLRELRSHSSSELEKLLVGAAQLTLQEKTLVMDLLDLDGTGNFSVPDFVRAIKLFAPACALEDLKYVLRRRQVQSLSDAFTSLPAERRDTPVGATAFNRLFDELGLSRGVHTDAVFDLAEPTCGAGICIGELVSALQCSSSCPFGDSPHCPVAREHVRWRMAPFHRSAAELRSSLRTAGHEQEAALPASPIMSAGGSCRLAAIHGLAGGGAREWEGSPKHGLSSPSSLGKINSPSAETRNILRSKGRHGQGQPENLSHQPTQKSFAKVSGLLRTQPGANHDPLLERIDKYYVSATQTVSKDLQLLAGRQSRLDQHRIAHAHEAAMIRKKPESRRHDM